VWTREHWLVNPRRYGGQRERIYLIRTPAFEPTPDFGAAELIAEGVYAARWFALGELDGLITGPRRLAELLRELLEQGPPPLAIDAGA
jgi:hypothetical protein